jgi:hypothetical protein
MEHLKICGNKSRAERAISELEKKENEKVEAEKQLKAEEAATKIKKEKRETV